LPGDAISAILFAMGSAVPAPHLETGSEAGMAFIDLELEAQYARMEHMGAEDARTAAEVGKGRARTRLIAVAILADMERQGRTLAVVSRPYAFAHPVIAAERVDIPAGFVTDFASIPRWLWFLAPPFGRHAPAAVLHDYLYAIGQQGARRYADFLFREAMRSSGVPRLRRLAMYFAVRVGGARGYGRAQDWSFVDPHDGQPLQSQPARPQLGYNDWRSRKRREKTGQKATG